MNPKIDHPKFRQTPIPNSYDKTFFQENKIDWHNYSLIEADKKRKGSINCFFLYYMYFSYYIILPIFIST